MKKKAFIILGIFFIVLAVAALVTGNADSTRVRNSAEPVHTIEEAVKIAQNNINEIEKSTIINFENPTVEELVLDEKVSFYLLNADENINGEKAYRITFNTEQDGLLGPIVYYIDKDNGKLLGLDYRE